MKLLLAFLFFATAFTAGASLPPELIADLSSPDLAKRFNAEVALRRLAFEAGKPGADPAVAATLSKELLGMASNTALPEETRASALEQLPFLADGACVPGLALLLNDPLDSIRELARRALQNNPDPQASQPLVEALGKSEKSPWVLGLLQALGARRDASAVPLIAVKLKSSDPSVSALAVQTLGSIGGKPALQALLGYLPSCPPSILTVAQSAVVRCAQTVGNSKTDILSLWPNAANAAIRCEIFNALVSLGNDGKAQKIVQQVLAAPTTSGAREILHLAVLSGRPSLKAPVTAALPGLPEDSRMAVHAALAEAGDSSQEVDLLAFASTLQDQKKAAAIDLLAVCGTGKSLEFLTAEFASNNRLTLLAASLALNRLTVPGLNERLLETAKGADATKARQAVKLLVQRNPPGMEPFFLNLAGPSAPPEGRQVALNALESVGTEASAKQLLTWIAETPEGGDPKPLIAAFRRLAPRLRLESQLWNQAFLPAYQIAPERNRAALLMAAPGLQCRDSAKTYVNWIRSEPAKRSDFVVQLIAWSDFQNGEFLLEAATIPDLDMPTREKLFQAATRLFFPNVQARPARLKKEFADKVLAASPEGPIRESVQKAITDSQVSK